MNDILLAAIRLLTGILSFCMLLQKASAGENFTFEIDSCMRAPTTTVTKSSRAHVLDFFTQVGFVAI